MKSILAISAEPGSLDNLIPALAEASYKLMPAYSDGDAFEMVMDATVALDAIVFLDSVPKQTRSTFKQLLSVEGLDFPMLSHQGSYDSLIETIKAAEI